MQGRTQIRASAGSGKTYRITMDFLDLLARAQTQESGGCAMLATQEYGWQEIMAVTFTNAAAAEMRKRVVETLKKIALGTEPHTTISRQDAGRWVERILERFGALNIRTIDSLLHTVVRLGALELDLPPDFEPVFDTREALDPLLDTLLESTRDHPGFAALLDAACREVVWHAPNFKGFQAGDTVRSQVMSLVLPLCVEGVAERLAGTEELATRYAELAKNVKNTATAMRERIRTEDLQANANFKKALDACMALGPKDDVPGSVMLRKTHLDECLNKASKGAATPVALQHWEALKLAVLYMERHGALIRAGLRLAPFARLAHLLAVALPAHLAAEGRVPQALIPSLAVRVLDEGRGVPETFCRMGASLSHILVDEFQDTSREQWAAMQPLALEALSRGGSLTWVGDVKQAIYGWRGGDATLFEEVADDEELSAVAPEILRDTLPCNRRSLEEIVLHNNTVFEKLAQPDVAHTVLRLLVPKDTPADTLHRGVALLTQAFDKAAQQPMDSKPGGYVRVDTLRAEKAAELEELVAARFVELMDELLLRRPAGDVAVLVRANRQVALVARWLMEMDVRVVTENSFLLAEHPLVRELLALLTFLDTPEDDTAFLGLVLGSQLFMPVSGLQEDEIHQWLAAVNGAKRDPLYRLFRQHFPDVWDRWIEPFYGSAGLLAAYDTVREALERFGAERRLPGQAVFAQRLLEVCHVAEGEGHASVSAFLDYWKKTGKDEKAPMPAGLDAVQVMTVHKSKGRQFPVVICPWQDLEPDPGTDPEMVPLHEVAITEPAKADPAKTEPAKTEPAKAEPAKAEPAKALCVLARPAKGLDSYYASLADSAREALHRLYVAWTRGEEELYIMVTATNRAHTSADVLEFLLGADSANRDAHASADAVDTAHATEETSAARTIMERGTPSSRPIPPAPVSASLPKNDAPAAFTETKTAHAETATPEKWRPLDWMPRLRIFRSPLAELAYTPKRRGVFVHHCLEVLRLTGDPAADAARAVNEGLATFPVPIREPELAKADLTERLNWYAALPETEQWMRHGVPERSLLDGEGRLFRADLVVDDGTAVTVIDYKTGTPENADEIAAHETQVRGYMTLLREAQPLPVSGRLVYMDLGEVRKVN